MKALVTGGGGFLGGAVVRLLLNRGASVRSFTRSAYPWLEELRVEQTHGDLADAEAIRAAVAGCDTVFHTAAKAGVWGRAEDYHATNVIGTENVLRACRESGVNRLVYTSTPSVVHTGIDMAGVDESTPYATQFHAAYPQTKAIAEQAVIAANGPDLATVALRPHLIWGPGDPHLIPRILARGRAGKLRRIGSRPVIIDTTFVDNAADAHILAADRLRPESPVAGKAYFISNGEPIPLWDFINRVLSDAGIAPVTRTIPVWMAKATGYCLEKLYRLFRLSGEPAMTRFVASQLSTSHYFDISAARNDLGYQPRVSIAEGFHRLAESYRPGEYRAAA